MAESRSTDWIVKLSVAIVGGALAVVVAGIVASVLLLNDDSSDANTPPVVTDADVVEIEMTGLEFVPAEVTISTGAGITWKNHDPTIHDATARDDSWTTDVLDNDESETITFDTPGTFEYYCTIHPWMEGTVTVR